MVLSLAAHGVVQARETNAGYPASTKVNRRHTSPASIKDQWWVIRS
jgi:hypothetical protein